MIASHTIEHTATLRQALARLNALSGGAMTLFVTDKDGRIAGTLTDGDIRRAILGGIDLDDCCMAAARSQYKYVREGDIDVETLRDYRRSGITLVPVVDADRRPTRLLDLTRIHTVLPLQAVLMAGGMGERLRPATLSTPKPLLTIEGKAIIDYNIEALAAAGIDDITVTTRYLAEQIEAHFAADIAGVHVRTVREDTPLGTIGAVALTDACRSKRHTLVMNSDLITTISFEDMYLHHRDTGADVTIAVTPYQVSVPYAILTLDSADPSVVTGIEEKPAYSYYANAGIYIFSPEVLSTLAPGERCDATDLIARAIADGRRVRYYIIKGTWIDVGSPVDFRQASELMRHHRNMHS